MAARIVTRERLTELLDFNPETGIFTWKTRPAAAFKKGQKYADFWNRKWAGKSAGSQQGETYILIPIDMVYYKAHRLAWLYHYGELPQATDHINHDFTDNRIANLRNTTNLQNHRNKPPFKKNKLGRAGIYLRHGSYVASIFGRGKAVHLGTYKTFEEACGAREKAEKKYGFHPNHGKLLQK